MTDTSQITSERKTSVEQAVELSLLMAIIAGSGAKTANGGGGEAYRDAVVTTFTQMLDGFGYRIVPKE